MLKKFFARRGIKGQVMVFFAVMLPVLFMFVGAAFEFGWWYFNQSRLQNAADAAVLAGAVKIRDETDPKYRLHAYTDIKFINQGDPEFEKFLSIKQTAVVDRSDAEEYISYEDAKKYAEDNLPKMEVVKLDEPKAYLVKDSKTVTEHIYYAVELTGKLDHLFQITKQFGDEMPIRAVALTRLTQVLEENAILPAVLLHRDGDADNGIKPKVIYDWQRSGQNYSNPRTVRTTNGTDNKSRNIDYTTGNTYRTEKIVLDGNTGYSAGKADMANTGDKYWRTYAASVKNGRYEMDDMFIDFRPEIVYDSRSFKEDWDITMAALSDMKYQYLSETKNSLDLRILATIDFNEPYEIRANKDSNGNEIKDSQGNSLLPTDPLYVRIESEPIYNDGITNVHSSVRQIIINVNPASDDPTGYNTKKDDDGNYLYRPLVIFYEGPEKLADTINPTSTVRDSKPVIINLNADFRGIIVMEHSPVVINGNGHEFHGFVIAKEFKHVKTDDDFSDCITYTKDGNEYLVRKADLLDQDELIEKLNSETDDNKIYYVDSGKVYSIAKSGNVKDADDYNTTDYIRANQKFNGSNDGNKGKAVYVLNGVTFGTTETKDWFEFTTRDAPEKSKYCVGGKDTNILLSYEGWTIIEDIAGKKWIVKNPNDLKKLYPEVTVDGETKYIGDRYYNKYDMNDTNSVYVDQKGEVHVLRSV